MGEAKRRKNVGDNLPTTIKELKSRLSAKRLIGTSIDIPGMPPSTMVFNAVEFLNDVEDLDEELGAKEYGMIVGSVAMLYSEACASMQAEGPDLSPEKLMTRLHLTVLWLILNDPKRATEFRRELSKRLVSYGDVVVTWEFIDLHHNFRVAMNKMDDLQRPDFQQYDQDFKAEGILIFDQEELKRLEQVPEDELRMRVYRQAADLGWEIVRTQDIRNGDYGYRVCAANGEPIHTDDYDLVEAAYLLRERYRIVNRQPKE